MAYNNGPKIVTNGLALMLDAANIKSFRGEPTTNLVTSAAAMSSWTWYYRTISASTFTTEFGTTGYRFLNQPSWNGVYRNFNLVNSGTYTFSAWFRYIGGSSNNNGATVYISNYGGGDTAIGLDKTKVGVWQRVSHTVSVTSPTNVYFYLISYGGTDSGTGNPDFSSWEVTMPQIELKSYATPFVDGTRGATVATGGGWADLSGNNGHGELVNNPTTNTANGGSIVFDGVNDYVKATSPGTYTEYTFIFFVKWLSRTANTSRCFGLDSYGTYTIFNPDDVSYHYNPLGGSPSSTTLTSGVNIGLNTWCCVAVTESRINSEVKIYVNGVLRNTTSLVSSQGFLGSLYLGAQNTISTVIANCEIANFNLYNRVLTSSEVLQNFNATRGRFGI